MMNIEQPRPSLLLWPFKRLYCLVKGHRRAPHFFMEELYDYCPRCGKPGKLVASYDDLIAKGMIRVISGGATNEAVPR